MELEVDYLDVTKTSKVPISTVHYTIKYIPYISLLKHLKDAITTTVIPVINCHSDVVKLVSISAFHAGNPGSK